MSAIRLSYPGQPPRLIQDSDPYLGLTQRQRHILDVVRAHNGNRCHAAKQLGIDVRAVQASLRLCQKAGARVPPGRTRLGIPNSKPVDRGPLCLKAMPSGSTCGRRLLHPGYCISEAAWLRKRQRGRKR